MKKYLFLLITLAIMIICFNCQETVKTETKKVYLTPPVTGLPTATTTPIVGDLAYTLSITGTTAVCMGTVTDQGESPVIERGICWNTTGSPTISDSHIASGSGTGSFTVTLTGLSVDTVYHVRSYAINYHGFVHDTAAYGNEITFNSGKTFGTDYAGGYVFYNDGNGGGLVSAKTDTAYNYSWSNVTSALVGTTSTAIGSGLANSNAIVSQSGHTNSAAKACLDYTDGTYSDWYLPSKDELILMYDKISGYAGFNDIAYWSSTEYDAAKAYFKNLSTGSGINVNKDYSSVFVRAVRTF